MLLSILLIVFGLTALDQGDVGRTLRRWLVEAPVRRLERLTRGQVLGMAVIVLLGWAAAALFEAEGLRLFAMAAPELTGWVLMFDITVVFDMMVLAVSLRVVTGWRGLAWATATIRGFGAYLAALIRRQARSRTRRVRRMRPSRGDSQDVEPDAVFA